jgi:hypothetical protein
MTPSETQIKILNRMTIYELYTGYDLNCKASTLWALVRLGYVVCTNVGTKGTLLDPVKFLTFKKIRYYKPL